MEENVKRTVTSEASGRPKGEGEASATKQKKPAPKRLACCVDYYDKLSNLLEDLRKVERFAQLLPAAEVIILNC